jgi:NTP pyrophosphatase (non-canonical NTP hydrolase)
MDREMTGNEYQAQALRSARLIGKEEQTLLNGVMGLAGESGECVDLMKKHLFHGHPLDREHMLLELGDVAWYLALSAYALDCDLETVFQKNLEKLRKRYPDGFATERSLHREEGDI